MGAIISSYAGSGGSAPFIVDSVSKADLQDTFHRSTQLVGAADSKLYTFVGWIKVEQWTAYRKWFGIQDATNWMHYVNLIDAPNGFEVFGRGNAGTTTVVSMRTSHTFVIDTWYCLMISWDQNNTSKRHIYVGDTSSLSVGVYNTAEATDFTAQYATIAGDKDTGSSLRADYGPLWIAPGQYIDFSIEANRRKFFSAAGKPVDAGPTGALPTGTAPLIYCRTLDGASPSSFATNLGTGGNFSVVGAWNTGPTSPSD